VDIKDFTKNPISTVAVLAMAGMIYLYIDVKTTMQSQITDLQEQVEPKVTPDLQVEQDQQDLPDRADLKEMMDPPDPAVVQDQKETLDPQDH